MSSSGASALSMADKLALWKAEKARAAATPAPPSATGTAKGGKNKRPFNAVTGNEKKKQVATKKVKSDAATTRPVVASAAAALSATPKAAVAISVPIAAPTVTATATAMVEEEEEEDLGLSFSSTECSPRPLADVAFRDLSVPLPVVAAPHSELPVATATPRANRLREAMNLTPPPSSKANTIRTDVATPRAAALARELRDEPFVTSSMLVGGSSRTMTPHAERLRDALRDTTPPMMTHAANRVASTATPVAASLASLLGGTSPTRTITIRPNSSVTPVAASLVAKLAMEDTPPEQKQSMSALKLNALVASVPRVHTATRTAASTPNTASPQQQHEIERENDLNSSVDSSVCADHDAPVARNLMSEMMEDLNSSMGSIPAGELNSSIEPEEHAADLTADHSTEADADADADGEADPDHIAMSAPLSSSSCPISLFASDDFIPGLSTPAAATSKYQPATSVAHTPINSNTNRPSLFSESEAMSPTPVKHTASHTHLRHAKLLTPSRAHLTSRHPLESPAGEHDDNTAGSNVVLATLKAHPRDAARMGSATFLSPVRRSTRNARAESNDATVTTGSVSLGAVPLADADQSDLQRMLEANNYAYHPNPALGRQLTPIPTKRTNKRTTMANRHAAHTRMEAIEENEANETSHQPVLNQPGHTPSQRAPHQSTPIPTRSMSHTGGSTLVVLQPVRRRRTSSAAASSSAMTMVDPSSSDYLLSPVRRSARHTAPQSFSDLAKLLASNQYPYSPNPMLEHTIAEAPSTTHTNTKTMTNEKHINHAQKGSNKDMILESVEEEEEVDHVDHDDEHASHHHPSIDAKDSMMVDNLIPSASAYPASASFSSSSSSRVSKRIGTPMPPTKSKSRMTVTENNWEKSYSSTPSSAASSFSKADLPLIHERDSAGFLIPLPPSKTRSLASHKRGRTVDDLEAKLSLVAVSMMEAAAASSSMVAGKSYSDMTQARTHTPRPTKKQKRATINEGDEENPYADEHSYSPRRSNRSRIATPIR